MKLRGGMSIGPITPGNFDGACKVAAAVTAAGAIANKYAGIGETTYAAHTNEAEPLHNLPTRAQNLSLSRQ